jgi:hypothetical protein
MDVCVFDRRGCRAKPARQSLVVYHAPRGIGDRRMRDHQLLRERT